MMQAGKKLAGTGRVGGPDRRRNGTSEKTYWKASRERTEEKRGASSAKKWGHGCSNEPQGKEGLGGNPAQRGDLQTNGFTRS